MAGAGRRRVERRGAAVGTREPPRRPAAPPEAATTGPADPRRVAGSAATSGGSATTGLAGGPCVHGIGVGVHVARVLVRRPGVRVHGLPVVRAFDGTLYAIGNQDPFTGAFVLSRGIVGTKGSIPTVASPLHKQVFDLRTGVCLDDDTAAAGVFGIRLRDGLVEVAAG